MTAPCGSSPSLGAAVADYLALKRALGRRFVGESRRYRGSPMGRRRNALRQRRHRERVARGEPAENPVTHQGSPPAAPDGEEPASVEVVRVGVPGPPSTSRGAPHVALPLSRCSFCGAPVAAFVRLDPLRGRRRPPPWR